MAKKTTGIRVRHSRSCPTARSGRCNCQPTYEATIGSGRAGTKLRKSFPTEAAAILWRSDAAGQLKRGTLRTRLAPTVRESGTQLVSEMKTGKALTKSGQPYKPSAVRSYEQALRLHVYPALGAVRLDEVRRVHVQRGIVAPLMESGADPSTIRNALLPLRVIYRRAIEDELVTFNPTMGLRLPAVTGRRTRIASPAEGAALIDALRATDRALWATAMFAGLRMGELRALRWSDIDLDHGLIHVERAMDHKGATIAPKSKAGRRRVPIAAALRDHLQQHQAETWNMGYVFGSSPTTPFTSSAVNRRAKLRWTKAKLTPIGLHEMRHTCASMFIRAGMNAKTVSTYMGHATIAVTFDLYGKLFPGNESQSATLLDAYLASENPGAPYLRVVDADASQVA